jgi:GNAT superfamily N-acetyltransferase
VAVGDRGSVRLATASGMAAAGRLLHNFNREFGEPTPPANVLADRLRDLVASGDTAVLLAGPEPVREPIGLAVLRFRGAIWSAGLECYLAELYVVPERRRRGVGRALMEAVLTQARERGADRIEIGVDEPDHAARQLYESFGFTNRTGGPDGPHMYVYERDL